MGYEFSEGDRFEQPNTYFYSAFGGTAFLDAWRAARDEALAELPAPARTPVARKALSRSAPYATDALLEGIVSSMEYGSDAERAVALEQLSLLARRYEIAKRLHEAYSETWRPQGAASDLAAHLRFAEALAAAYARHGDLPRLNVLLKVLDQLVSVRDRVPEAGRGRLARILLLERTFVEQLGARAGGGAVR